METLTDSTRIIAIFKRLLERRALLTVRIDSQPQHFTTALLDISTDGGALLLDELKPEAGHKLLQETPSFQVRAQLEGVEIGFHATVTQFDRQDGIAIYRVPVPGTIAYHQRRQGVRVQLSHVNPLPVSLTSTDGITVTGSMADLSIGGLRIHFTNELPETLQSGARLECSFPLPPDNKERFTCDVVIRVIKHSPDNLKTAFMGGQFVEITKPQERLIERTVMTLQRLAQQKRNG